MPSKRLTKKTVLNPIIIAGFIVIALLLIIIAAMGRALTPSLKTQIAPSTAPTATPPTEKQCGPQQLLEVVGPWDVYIDINFNPDLNEIKQIFDQIKLKAVAEAPSKCNARANQTPTIDFFPCPTPSPKPTDYVCLENEEHQISCRLASSRELKKAPRAEETVFTERVSCVRSPRRPVRISDDPPTWRLNMKCTATCLCQRACDVKEGTPVDL